MNTPSERPASADASPGQTSQSPRERRCGDRRKPRDRRAKRRKTPPMRMELKALIGLLVFSSVYFIVTKLMEEPQMEKMVVVEVDKSSHWQCAPRELAQFFASEDIMKGLEAGKELNETVRKKMVLLKTENLLLPEREVALLDRVRKMPWEEFGERGTFVRNGDKATPPEGVTFEKELKRAEIQDRLVLND